jgi:hypothetical protein
LSASGVDLSASPAGLRARDAGLSVRDPPTARNPCTPPGIRALKCCKTGCSSSAATQFQGVGAGTSSAL